MDISALKAKLKRVEGQNFSIQTQAITSMIGEVGSFVDRIHEEEQIASQTSSLRSELERLKRSNDDKDKQKVREAQETYNEAEQSKRHISTKKAELRNLKTKLDQIRTEINRVIN